MGNKIIEPFTNQTYVYSFISTLDISGHTMITTAKLYHRHRDNPTETRVNLSDLCSLPSAGWLPCSLTMFICTVSNKIILNMIFIGARVLQLFAVPKDSCQHIFKEATF